MNGKIPLWRLQQRKAFTRIEPLCNFLELSPSLREELLKNSRFPLNLPLRLAEKIEKNSLDDPILRQFVPLVDEIKRVGGFCSDPVQDQEFRKAKKLLHKYKGRALLLVTSACAMHCRFCFRQNFPYETQDSDFSEELQLLASDRSISEVILSGGDPLSFSDERLQALLESLDAVSHIQRIRFHTRFPIGIPERIDDSFLKLLQGVNKQVYFAIHCNHPKELDADVISSLQKIAKLGIPLLSQTVLLKGVNDCQEVLLQLFEKMINAGIVPYYLHALDPVDGSAHFAVTEEKGMELVRALRSQLPGYAVPRFVREEPGKPSKTVTL